MSRFPLIRALLPLASLALCAETRLEFNRDVRPILSDKCYHCHGPDAVAKKIPLRLDREPDAKADLRGRHAVVEGHPEQSEMIRRISSDPKSGIHMPPAYSGLALTQNEIGILRDWIAQGAKWQQHWSFIPPVRPPLPSVKHPEWAKNPIDYFVLERLERENLSPSQPAGRETLLRRVSLDVTGLPPTPAEIDAFLSDRSPNAYEKVVDRLFASPRFGERMAARWLDAARYADTNGYQYDGERQMWRWRDWVINAFNRNQPFNQFTLEQIAGDMLPNATLDQKIATGFNRNHRANTEDGIIPEEYAVEYVVDRVETTSTVFLGLTLGCARCHNHKYDPLSQAEFYKVFAYFNNVPELGRAMKYGNSPPMIPAPTAEQQRALAELDGRVKDAEKFLAAQESAIRHSENSWAARLVNGAAQYWAPATDAGLTDPSMPEGPVAHAPGRIGQAGVFDGKAYLQFAEAAAFDIEDRFTLSAWVKPEAPDGSIFSRMSDKAQGKGYGVYLKGGKIHVHLTSNYVNDAIRVDSEQTISANQWHHVLITYTGSRMAEGIGIYIDGRLARFKVEADTLYRPFRNAGAKFKEPFRVGAGGGPERRFHGLIDDVRVYSRVVDEDEIAALALGEPLGAIAGKPASERSKVESYILRTAFLEGAAPTAFRDASKRLSGLRQEREALRRTFPTVMVMAERPVRKDTFLLTRGAYDKPAGKVEPGVPAILPPLPAGAPNNRLGFAMWLTDPGNPLLARVTMNRFWQMYFGVGLVKTTEDFGMQGEWPSHPELLDWLATEFVSTGWDVKAMLKKIVTSATYRQSSQETPELLQKDPDNRLLARAPRFRLPAETIRDQALYNAGLLTEKLGGPSVKPYQPAGLWKELSMQDMDYIESKGGDQYRRGLYTFWKRTVAPPMMVNFDAANRESCVVRASRTNTPLQALNLMNDVTFVEAARFIGQRMMKEGGSEPNSRLRYGFRLVAGRAPSPVEEQVLRRNLQYHLEYFANDDAKAQSFLRNGISSPDPKLAPRELAAYASVASLLLNLDEAVSKE